MWLGGPPLPPTHCHCPRRACKQQLSSASCRVAATGDTAVVTEQCSGHACYSHTRVLTRACLVALPGFGIDLAAVLELLTPVPLFFDAPCNPSQSVLLVRGVFQHMPALALLYLPVTGVIVYWLISLANDAHVTLPAWVHVASARWLMEVPMMAFVVFLFAGVWSTAYTVSDVLPFLAFPEMATTHTAFTIARGTAMSSTILAVLSLGTANQVLLDGLYSRVLGAIVSVSQSHSGHRKSLHVWASIGKRPPAVDFCIFVFAGFRGGGG